MMASSMVAITAVVQRISEADGHQGLLEFD
jgi:hypothetical protein